MSEEKDYKPVVQGDRLKLVYDVKSVPDRLPMTDMVKFYQNHDIIFWDSSKGVKPIMYNTDGEKTLPLLVDTAGVEIDIDYYTRVLQEEEFWKKELHNCKMSPIHFWSNYGTPVWPHKDADMKAYLESHGIGEVVAKDTEEAEKLWAEQKETMRKLTDTYTIELLKERKAYLDVMKNSYEERVSTLEKLVGPKVKLVDKNNVPLELRRRIGNLVEKIRYSKIPVPPQYSDKYRNPKNGKWDNAMLFVTDYDVLLKIFYDVLRAKGWEPESVDSSAKDTEGAEVDASPRDTMAGPQSK